MAEHYTIYGWAIYYENESDVRSGLDYLYRLTSDEFQTFVDGARADGKAHFENTYGERYTLTYDYSSKTLTLERIS